MYLKSPWQHTRALLTKIAVLNLLALVCAVSEDTTKAVCDTLNCQNNSPCRVITEGNVSTAECACLQGWVGARCHARLQLTMAIVTMTTVTLRLDTLEVISLNINNTNSKGAEQFVDLNETSKPITESRTSESGFDNTEQTLNKTSQLSYVTDTVQSFSYSVHYWLENQLSSCNIIPKLSTNVLKVSGLVRNATYTFCAKTHHVGLCNDLVSRQSNVSYCVAVTTKTSDDAGTSSVPALYIVLATSIATVVLFIMLAVVVVSIRTRLLCARNEYNKRKRRKGVRSRTSSADTTHELLLFGTPPTNQRVNINPPSSPGKPKHMLVQNRTRGYASFTAKNEQTYALSTVIEYPTPEDNQDNSDDNDEETHFGESRVTSRDAQREYFGAKEEVQL